MPDVLFESSSWFSNDIESDVDGDGSEWEGQAAGRHETVAYDDR